MFLDAPCSPALLASLPLLAGFISSITPAYTEKKHKDTRFRSQLWNIIISSVVSTLHCEKLLGIGD